MSRPLFARLAGVSAVAVHKLVKRKLAAAYQNGLIDREAPEAVAYLENRVANRTAYRPRAPQASSCREIGDLRAALQRWQRARAAAVQAETTVLLAVQRVLERFGKLVEPTPEPDTGTEP